MKNVSVILAHPNKESFNHAIAEITQKTLVETGHHIFFHDLYAEGFDPLFWGDEKSDQAEIESYGNELLKSSGIVIIHPNWWGQPPAILKGWVDRIFRLDVAYRYEQDSKGGMIRKGALPFSKALIVNTANVPAEREEQMGNTLEYIWKDCIFEPCGVPNVVRKSFTPIVISTYEQRQLWLKEVEKTILEIFSNYETV